MAALRRLLDGFEGAVVVLAKALRKASDLLLKRTEWTMCTISI
jgi:hypothetical protein